MKPQILETITAMISDEARRTMISEMATAFIWFLRAKQILFKLV